ncbi:ParB family protein [Escherichia coli]|uniref:ParB family protein n=1 Tax=Escherichia coli TaxID=562 RepID=UPI0035A33DEC
MKGYHRVCWPFRPWPETLSPQQGEVQCLIGHLAESDLHNGLMFIERAEGVLHLRDLYHKAGIECPTQLALAEQLTRDGYPVSQSQISRMLQTVDWLLPCIPNALYGGLTRKVIDRLLALRSAAEQVWAKLMPLERQPEFADLFSTALATFNDEPEAVVPQLEQDELLGEMSCRSGMSWNTLLAELTDGQSSLIQADRLGKYFVIFSGEQRAIGERMLVKSVNGYGCIGYGEFIKMDLVNHEPFLNQLKQEVVHMADDFIHYQSKFIKLQHALIDLIDYLEPKYIRLLRISVEKYCTK